MGRLAKGYWRTSGSGLPSSVPAPTDYWRDLGLGGFADPTAPPDALQTAGCGSACPVVWERAGVSPGLGAWVAVEGHARRGPVARKRS
jgi:hypothetical protein